MIKIGRRGSLTAWLTAYGVQGHAAYPERAKNPLPALVRLLDRLAVARARPRDRALRAVDAGDHHDRHRQSGVERDPGRGAGDGEHPLQRRPHGRVADRLDRGGGRPRRQGVRRRHRRALPDLGGELPDRAGALHRPGRAAVPTADRRRRPELSTSGGTSDARFVKDHCPVVEFGLVGTTMHQVDEHVEVAHIGELKAIYAGILSALLFGRPCLRLPRRAPPVPCPSMRDESRLGFSRSSRGFARNGRG